MVNNSTNINKTNNYLSPQTIEQVEKQFTVLSEIFVCNIKIYKIFMCVCCTSQSSTTGREFIFQLI
jgi:hypothetical protein